MFQVILIYTELLNSVNPAYYCMIHAIIWCSHWCRTLYQILSAAAILDLLNFRAMGIQTNKLDLVTFTYTFLPLLSVPVLVLFCESLHSEIDIKWAKIGLEVRLADERSTTDAFSSPLGWSPRSGVFFFSCIWHEELFSCKVLGTRLGLVTCICRWNITQKQNQIMLLMIYRALKWIHILGQRSMGVP